MVLPHRLDVALDALPRSHERLRGALGAAVLRAGEGGGLDRAERADVLGRRRNSPASINTRSAAGPLAPLDHPRHARPRLPRHRHRYRTRPRTQDADRPDRADRQRVPPPVRRPTARRETHHRHPAHLVTMRRRHRPAPANATTGATCSSDDHELQLRYLGRQSSTDRPPFSAKHEPNIPTLSGTAAAPTRRTSGHNPLRGTSRPRHERIACLGKCPGRRVGDEEFRCRGSWRSKADPEPDSPSWDVGSIRGNKTPRSSWSASGSRPPGILRSPARPSIPLADHIRQGPWSRPRQDSAARQREGFTHGREMRTARPADDRRQMPAPNP
jgi:hypothetical protein